MIKPLLVLINHHSGLNGAELSFFDVVKTVDQSRFTPHVVLPANGPLAERIKALNIPVTFIPQQGWRWYYASWWGRLKFLLTYPFIWEGIRQYRKFFREHQPALVYLNINRLFVPLLAASKSGLPTIVHFRDIPSKVKHDFLLGRKQYFRILNRASVWIANSQATKNDIQPWTDKHVPVIYNGIDGKAFLTRSNHALVKQRPAGKKVIAMIGTLTPWKNQREFITLASHFRSHPELVFWIIGEGTERASLEAYVSQLGLRDQVIFIGFVTEVAPLYMQLDVLVHTMPGESFGRVFVEAMISKVPVVAYRSGAASDIIDDGITGWLTDDFDVDQLTERVKFVLANEEVVKKVVDNASRKAETAFSIERLSKEMNSVFEDLLKR